MTLGFALFGIGFALLISALKDQSLSEILSGAIGADVPLGKGTGASTDLTSPGAMGGVGNKGNVASSPALLAYLQTAAKEMFHLNISEPIGRDSGGHVSGSLHGQGRAFDASGSESNMRAYTDWVKQNFGGSITELIHNPGGSIKNGKSVPPSFWDQGGRTTWEDHAGHVHTGI